MEFVPLNGYWDHKVAKLQPILLWWLLSCRTQGPWLPRCSCVLSYPSFFNRYAHVGISFIKSSLLHVCLMTARKFMLWLICTIHLYIIYGNVLLLIQWILEPFLPSRWLQLCKLTNHQILGIYVTTKKKIVRNQGLKKYVSLPIISLSIVR
jgi:hypothetical protein